MQGLLSIVTATYNNADLLPRFFASVLAQEYTNWELVIINDGSTDNTAEVCKAYANKDKRIRYYEQHNQGQGVARNWALDLIHGEYIAFLDADDAIKENTYTEAIKTLEKHESDIVAFPIEWINKTERFTTFREGAPINGYKYILEDLFVNKTLKLLITDKLYKANLLEELRFVPRIVFDDNLMMVQIALRAKQICFSTKGAYEYHQEEYELDKNNWTPHKECSQIFVNCRYIDELSGDNLLRNCRAKVYQQIGNQLVYLIRKNKKGDNENIQLLRKYIKAMPIGDAICNSVLSIKHKVKLLLLMGYSHFPLLSLFQPSKEYE